MTLENVRLITNSDETRVMALSQYGQGYLFWDWNFHPIFVFWAIILAPDMLESQSRALKTQMMA